MAFQSKELLPGVWHIQDKMGVCMTLLCGEERALLIDTGYGFEDVAAYVRTLTEKPLSVMLTHGHHDHALGARWFDRVYLAKDDFPVYETYTQEFWRKRVLGQARDKGFDMDEGDFLSAKMAAPEVLDEKTVDLGGLTARIILCPGHTPGSAAVYVPERELLITGDDWNPCTWLFFPEALCVQDYRRNMRHLLALPFGRVLCSHQFMLFDRTRIDQFMESLTDGCLKAAKPVEEGARVGVRTSMAQLPMDQVFVFDRDKFEQNLGKEAETDD